MFVIIASMNVKNVRRLRMSEKTLLDLWGNRNITEDGNVIVTHITELKVYNTDPLNKTKYFIVCGTTPGGDALGYDESGQCFFTPLSGTHWSLTPPTKEKKLKAYLVPQSFITPSEFYKGHSLFFTCVEPELDWIPAKQFENFL